MSFNLGDRVEVKEGYARAGATGVIVSDLSSGRCELVLDGSGAYLIARYAHLKPYVDTTVEEVVPMRQVVFDRICDTFTASTVINRMIEEHGPYVDLNVCPTEKGYVLVLMTFMKEDADA